MDLSHTLQHKCFPYTHSQSQCKHVRRLAGVMYAFLVCQLTFANQHYAQSTAEADGNVDSFAGIWP